MKNILIKIIPVLIFVFLTGTLIGVQALSESVSDDLVRFHIVADSNSEASQNVKWQVRKEIFETLDLSGINSKEEALSYFKSNRKKITDIADKVLSENNMHYKSHVYIGKKTFPVREYKSFILPAGVYDAVCVTLGEGKGENFFCVMYPSLCMISSVTEKTEENAELLNSVLTEKETKAVTDTGNKTVIKFKFAEIAEKIMSK